MQLWDRLRESDFFLRAQSAVSLGQAEPLCCTGDDDTLVSGQPGSAVPRSGVWPEQDALRYESVLHRPCRQPPSLRQEPMEQPERPPAPRTAAVAQQLLQSGFGLAFGGGGVRAAAFDCGALWALAERGLLDAVTHLSSVSGGGYAAAAFASHLRATLADGQPDPHLRAAAGTISRMQANIGYLVTCEKPLCSKRIDGSSNCPSLCCVGWVPRFLDGPLLGLLVLMMIITSPLLYIVFIAYPFAEIVDLLAGSTLRAEFCASAFGIPPSRQRSLTVLYQGWQGLVVIGALGVVVLAIGVVSVRKEPPHYRAFLYFHETRRLIVRLCLLCLAVGLVFVLVHAAQFLQWPTGDLSDDPNVTRNTAACIQYIRDRVDGSERSMCSDWLTINGSVWYDAPLFRRVWENTTAPTFDTDTSPINSLGYVLLSLCVFFVVIGVWGLAFGVSWLGPLVAVWAPIFGFYMTAAVAQWRIFGPITGQDFLVGNGAYDPGRWRLLVTITCGLCVLVLPLYGVIFRFVHFFFRKRLVRAFFYQGEDVHLAECAAAGGPDRRSTSARGLAGAEPGMPLLLFGATLNEFRRPTDPDNSNSSTFCFSPYMMGGGRTGYVAVPPWLKLSRAMAISGAAVDALILTSMDTFSMRVWMALLNLSMGDWVRFAPRSGDRMRESASLPSRKAAPVLFLLSAVYAMIAAAVYVQTTHTGESDVSRPSECGRWDALLLTAIAVVLVTFSISFYAFEPAVAQHFLSPAIVRQWHTVMGHPLCAAAPPPFVYLTDGGTTEDLSLVHLLRRRPRYVIVCDTGDDPSVKLIDLRNAISVLRAEKVASVFAVDDPRRDVEQVLEEYAEGSAVHLHLRVLYGWGETRTGEVADMFHVRMRVPKDDTTPVQPLVGEEEVMAGPMGVPDADPELVPWTGLGGFCCESSRKCCGGFPDIGTGNQFFTPTLFANYCRLGRRMIGAAADALSDVVRADAEPAAAG